MIEQLAAVAGKIAFLPLGKSLFWPAKSPRNAQSSSAFSADITGNPKK
jgi:hypothetical protein